MPSVTDLLNDSLGQIGEQPITAIDDGTNNANYCGRFYPSLLDSALQAHESTPRPNLEAIAAADVWARRWCENGAKA